MVSESFIRWQNYTIQQFSYANNLFLVLSIATLGFIFNLIRDPGFSASYSSNQLFVFSLLLIMASVATGCIATLSRLHDFRYTARIARKKDKEGKDENDNKNNSEEIENLRSTTNLLGKITWGLFWTQITTFMLGVLIIIYPLYDSFIK